MQVSQLLPVVILDLLVVEKISLHLSTVIHTFTKRSSVELEGIIRRKDLQVRRSRKLFCRSLLLSLLTLLERLMSVT